MVGHSKWSKIKRQKQVSDIAKGALFAKLSRSITFAVQKGGGVTDPGLNVRLRLAVDKARELNVPKENIQRAIERGSGTNAQALKEVRYEAFAPHGVMLIIIAATDNPNRTYSEIRNALEHQGGKLGEQGSAMYLFQQCGTVRFHKQDTAEPAVLKAAENLQAFDIEQDEESYTLYFPFENIRKLSDGAPVGTYDPPEVDYRAENNLQLTPDQEVLLLRLIESLEALDDVQSVYTNVIQPSRTQPQYNYGG